MIRRKIIKITAIILVIFFTFSAGVWYGQKQIPFVGPLKIINEDSGKPRDLDFSLFWDTWRILEEKYPTKPDKIKMFYGAISGMVKSLGDPYTVFMDPAETKKFSEELNGVFDGIGAEIGVKKEIITIVAPLPESPAEKAGLKPMDKILKINDTSTMDLSLDEAVNLIRGPKGTVVVLTILRGNESETREFKITRDTITVNSVNLKFDSSGKEKIAILKISQFEADTFQNINSSADEILKQGAKGIILDLRNNPGGFLESAVDIGGVFMPSGKIVTTEKSSSGNKEHLTQGDDKLGALPMVILANEGSASAAEILAGALRDNRQIKIIGEKTFGKGSVQQIQDFTKDGSSLKITIAEWLTPSGKNINKEGLKPDIEISISKDDFDAGKDPQMEKALQVINEGL